MLVLTVLEQTEDSESPVWSIDKANKLGLRKGRMKGLILQSNYPITNALKAGHSELSPGMQQGASSTPRERDKGPQVSAGMGVQEMPGFNRAWLWSQAHGRGALGRYSRQVTPDFSWCLDQPSAGDGLAASCPGL